MPYVAVIHASAGPDANPGIVHLVPSRAWTAPFGAGLPYFSIVRLLIDTSDVVLSNANDDRHLDLVVRRVVGEINPAACVIM